MRERRIPLNLSYSNVPRKRWKRWLKPPTHGQGGAPRFQDADAMFDSLGI
ncbi:DNA-damage-inducible protein J [Bifidobacterium animalis]|nr:DNA-damage-inducible protein J [Bifidobacterium animalis]